MTALHFAAGSGNAELAIALLNGGARVDIVDNDGNTALHMVSSLFVARMNVISSYKLPSNICKGQ